MQLEIIRLTNMDVSNFPTSYHNMSKRWNVFCVVYDTTSRESSLIIEKYVISRVVYL